MLKEKALNYLSQGIPVIPINRESKKPAVLWKEYQTRLPTVEEASSWPWDAIALLTGPTSGYAVVDCDTKDAGHYWHAWRPRTPMVAKSRRGYHFFYCLCGQDIRSNSGILLADGLTYDVKAHASYVIIEPTPGYRFIWGMRHPDELPEFNPAWRPTKWISPAIPIPQGPPTHVNDAIHRILDTAVKEAACGRNQAGFRMALQLRDHGMSLQEAFSVMDDYAARVRHIREGVYDASEARQSARSAYSGKRREPWCVR